MAGGAPTGTFRDSGGERGPQLESQHHSYPAQRLIEKGGDPRGGICQEKQDLRAAVRCQYFQRELLFRDAAAGQGRQGHPSVRFHAAEKRRPHHGYGERAGTAGGGAEEGAGI